ncbi:MAG: PRC-barrel domain-containing protein [Solirubrobacteraceae bacterium]
MMVDDGVAKPGPAPESSISESARFSIGTEVFASDGTCGELIRVIIDPVARALTHLVVAPKHHETLGRLVPVELVESDGDQIRLSCTEAQFHELDDAEDIQVLPASSDVWGYRSGQAFSWPYYGLGMGGGIGPGGMGASGMGLQKPSQPVATDRVPVGEVQVRRGDDVHASDGWIGSVQGLVIDPGDHHVTHVLLQEGHLWGRKQVAIPIGATSRMEIGIRVKLTKQQVHDLPPVVLSSSP